MTEPFSRAASSCAEEGRTLVAPEQQARREGVGSSAEAHTGWGLEDCPGLAVLSKSPVAPSVRLWGEPTPG